jgi:hypothetical protein
MGNFREIVIPGVILDNDNLPDSAKILYGKIARLSYKNGYCWASNSTLSGTKSGNTASRNVKLLEKFGYIRCIYENKMQDRKIYLSEINDCIAGETPPKNGETPSPKMVNKQYKMNIQTNTQNEQEKKTTGSESEILKKHFIKLWQENSDVFNSFSRLHYPKDFDGWWEKSHVTTEMIDLAVKNVADAVKSGALERRFVPGSPDKFVLNGWIHRSQEPYALKSGPSPPEERRFGRESKGTVDLAAIYRRFNITGTEPEKRRRLLELREQGVVSF